MSHVHDKKWEISRNFSTFHLGRDDIERHFIKLILETLTERESIR